MQLIQTFGVYPDIPFAGHARAMIVGGAGIAATAEACLDLGLEIEIADEIYDALADVADDPKGYSVFVLDCDSFGGIEAGRRTSLWLSRIAPRVAVILVTRTGTPHAQDSASGQHAPTVLCRPQTTTSVRHALQHAFGARGHWCGIQMLTTQSPVASI